ncbi:MAG: 4-(cytidine 5'-diphospho)-2-C-methyl-D-erythritol kinase [Butyrivibrio sp.]|nr:4-(cytidine 5'-diphospho)-2-C-methyl-D-erythritol kinase [Butyrivibrio sp.]
MNYIGLKAYAKINLGLDVLGTLDNGYHEVRMIMQSVDLYDKVGLRKNTDGRINVSTNLPFLPVNKDNLVYKAAALLKEEFGIKDGVDISLYKFIPVAAGLAGGSSDAAAVLRGMNRLFRLRLSVEELMERGVKIGADVPYCVMRGTALAEGIGERLTRLKRCPACKLVIGKPAVSVSTKYVYDRLILDENTKHPDIDGIIDGINNGSIYEIADRLGNVLESVTENAYPVIGELKAEMKKMGALNAIMSGSGPTVFGIFDDAEKAEACNGVLKKSGLTKTSYVVGLANGGTE